ncbi:MAG: hypothetical protein IKO10_17510, partial [Lachnospiraceae bacterium]|nr:hypothetical protein [Lachnospiraceae bacterium]
KTALSAPASMYTPQTFVHLTRPSGTLPSRGGQEFFATATELAKYEFIDSLNIPPLFADIQNIDI